MFDLKKRAIASKIQNNPFYRFSSLSEIEIAAKLGIKIDVNQAGVDDWLRLPGISIHQAKVLVELVSRGVQLVCIEDIAAVLNVPLNRLICLEPILHFAYYHSLSPASQQQLNLNQVSATALSQIPGCDRDFAELIIQEKANNGRDKDFADFQARLNISNDSLEKLIYFLKI